MSAIQIEDQQGSERGYALLTRLGLMGWSAVVTPDGDSGVEVQIGRFGSRTLRERGANVAEVAPRLYERAMCLS